MTKISIIAISWLSMQCWLLKMAILNVSVACLSTKRTLFPWNIVSTSEPEHSFRDFFYESILPRIPSMSELPYDLVHAVVGTISVYDYFLWLWHFATTWLNKRIVIMNNELPALMLDSSCCYRKQGIILEWPYLWIPIPVLEELESSCSAGTSHWRLETAHGQETDLHAVLPLRQTSEQRSKKAKGERSC